MLYRHERQLKIIVVKTKPGLALLYKIRTFFKMLSGSSAFVQNFIYIVNYMTEICCKNTKFK